MSELLPAPDPEGACLGCTYCRPGADRREPDVPISFCIAPAMINAAIFDREIILSLMRRGCPNISSELPNT